MKLTKDLIQNRYAEYDSRVIDFLNNIYEDIRKENKNISNYFLVTFDLLANQCKIYFMAIDAIDKENSISSEDHYKRVSKSPSIAILNHAHQEILKILDDYGLSPFSAAKIKRLNKGGDDDESAEALLNNLIN